MSTQLDGGGERMSARGGQPDTGECTNVRVRKNECKSLFWAYSFQRRILNNITKKEVQIVSAYVFLGVTMRVLFRVPRSASSTKRTARHCRLCEN